LHIDSSKIRGIVSASVMDERERQEAKWGEQNHEPCKYLAILAEEFGEVSEAVVHLTFGDVLKLKDGTVLTTVAEVEKHYMEELVQLAAVAQAMVESVLRRKMLEAATREAMLAEHSS
jgi:NTP pyrophosphatase (non-canonical NTP hydrolase)